MVIRGQKYPIDFYFNYKVTQNMTEITECSGEEPDNCWICLDPSTTNIKTNPLIKSCGCNLYAHKRCILNWASSVTLQHTQTENEERLNEINANETLPGFSSLSNLGLSVVQGNSDVTNTLRNSASSLFTYTNPSLHCPQCRTPILFTQKPSYILSFSAIVREVGKLGIKFGLITYLGTGALATLITTVITTASSIGFGLIWNQLAPQSVLLKLLNVKGTGTFEKALDKGKIGFTELSLIAGAPFYMLGLRGGHYSQGSNGGFNSALGLSALYPLLFYLKDVSVLSNWETFYVSKDPRNWLLCIDPLSFVYDICYCLTLNRLCYRWCMEVKPWFIKNRLTKEEVIEIEEEITELRELQESRRQTEQSQNLNVVKKVLNSIAPNITERERKLINKKAGREISSSIKNNYMNPFIPQSHMLTVLTTFAWPTLGSLLNEKVLSKFSKFHSFLSLHTNTPDEATYLGNLIACAVLVVLKDLLNLGLVYLKYRQLRDIDILDAKQFAAKTGIELIIVRSEENNDANDNNEVNNHDLPEQVEQEVEDLLDVAMVPDIPAQDFQLDQPEAEASTSVRHQLNDYLRTHIDGILRDHFNGVSPL